MAAHVRHQWTRIHSSKPLDVVSDNRYKKRVSRLQDVVFHAACKIAGIEPTIRQARKWNNGNGLAIRFRRQAHRNL